MEEFFAILRHAWQVHSRVSGWKNGPNCLLQLGKMRGWLEAGFLFAIPGTFQGPSRIYSSSYPSIFRYFPFSGEDRTYQYLGDSGRPCLTTDKVANKGRAPLQALSEWGVFASLPALPLLPSGLCSLLPNGSLRLVELILLRRSFSVGGKNVRYNAPSSCSWSDWSWLFAIRGSVQQFCIGPSSAGALPHFVFLPQFACRHLQNLQASFSTGVGPTPKGSAVDDCREDPSNASQSVMQNQSGRSGKGRSSDSQDMQRLIDAKTVWSICNVLKEGHWGPETAEALGQLQVDLRARHVNRVVRQLQNADVALQFFKWADGQPSYHHSTYTYNAIIERMGAAKNVEAQYELLQDMHRQGCQMNVATFNILFVSFSRARNTQGVVDTFDRMAKYGCSPNAFTFKCVIRSLVWGGDVLKATETYRQMLQFGFVPDNFTYNGLIDGLCKVGNVNAAYEIFQEMGQHGCTPDAYAHVALMRGFDATVVLRQYQ